MFKFCITDFPCNVGNVLIQNLISKRGSNFKELKHVFDDILNWFLLMSSLYLELDAIRILPVSIIVVTQFRPVSTLRRYIHFMVFREIDD